MKIDFNNKVYIIYEDSAISSSQTDEIIAPAVIHCLGFVIRSNKKYITLAQEVVINEPDKEVRAQVSIPKSAITFISYLELPNPH